MEATPRLPNPPSTQMSSTSSNDILSWTNQDPRESVLFNSWGVVYRFQVSLPPLPRFVHGDMTSAPPSPPLPLPVSRPPRAHLVMSRFSGGQYGPTERIEPLNSSGPRTVAWAGRSSGRSVAVKPTDFHAHLSQNAVPMADLVRPDPRTAVSFLSPDRCHSVLTTFQGVRLFNGPDGLIYRWRPHGNDVLVGVTIHHIVASIDTGLCSCKTPQAMWSLYSDRRA